jgi:hypothetical protein
MKKNYPRIFDWIKEKKPYRLSAYLRAPNKIGFYELGIITNKGFEAKYAGRAIGMTLRNRLGQHYNHSHNETIRRNRDNLYFRYKVFTTVELVSYVEAVSIAAFNYDWNRRNEWTQHWILDD